MIPASDSALGLVTSATSGGHSSRSKVSAPPPGPYEQETITVHIPIPSSRRPTAGVAGPVLRRKMCLHSPAPAPTGGSRTIAPLACPILDYSVLCGPADLRSTQTLQLRLDPHFCPWRIFSRGFLLTHGRRDFKCTGLGSTARSCFRSTSDSPCLCFV